MCNSQKKKNQFDLFYCKRLKYINLNYIATILFFNSFHYCVSLNISTMDLLVYIGRF